MKLLLSETGFRPLKYLKYFRGLKPVFCGVLAIFYFSQVKMREYLLEHRHSLGGIRYSNVLKY